MWTSRAADRLSRASSKVTGVTRYGEAGRDIHGMSPGTALTMAFELNGQPFTALNGGPAFQFNEAVSLQVHCETQEELDYYWDKLSKGGDAKAQQCGWLKDKFGLSWQVVPTILDELLNNPDRAKSERVMAALLNMKELDIDALRRA